MMAGVGAVQVERSKLSDKVIGCSPHLDVRVVRSSNVSNMTHETRELQAEFCMTYLPSGENFNACTGLWKLKWCRTTPRLKLTRRARPSMQMLGNS